MSADAIIKSTENYDKPEPLNIGTGEEIAIKDLVSKIKKIVGFGGKIVWDKTKPDGQPRRCLDVSKAEKEIGFKASTSLETGLEQTVKWYITQKS